MLDEIIPELRFEKKLKMLTPDPKFIEALPEIYGNLSFVPILNYLKEKRSAASDLRAKIYDYLIQRLEELPILLQPIKSIRVLNEHQDLLELLKIVLFPLIGEYEKNIFTFASPYKFSAFYYSDSFQQLFVDEGEESLLMPTDMDQDKLKHIYCTMV